MAEITRYTARQGLNPGSTPGVELINPVAQEVQQIGKAATNFANTLQQRQEQKENFKVENDYRRLQLQLGNDLNSSAQSMAEDGTGFHDDFMQTKFQPARDQFLAGVPDRLKSKFETLLTPGTGADAEEWSIKAATTERDQNYAWQKQEISLTQEQQAVAISMDPENYDPYLADGMALIDASSLPTPEKAKLRQDWEKMAQVAMLNQLLETDPRGVLRELGYDPRQLSPTTQFEVLSRAVQWQESADNPNAVSGKGAVGLMQVMPATAREIAGKLGDAQFPAGENDTAVSAYMTNPYVNKRYGEYYLKEQLRKYAGARDPIEAALVAYNAGPGTADKWIESGYDDKLLPKETRDYKSEIMATLKSAPVKGDPSSVSFVGDISDTSADLQGRLKDAFATVGLTKIKVNSGNRTAEENTAAGGAENSQHLHGNAMDIDVSGMKITDRIELIKALSNAGVTGLGIGSNIIHADLGGRRAWGYKTSAGGGEVPKWAQAVIGQHLNGTTPPPRAVNQRYASLPYDTRQQFTSKADQLITANAAQATKSSAVEKVNVRTGIDNELALIRTTGQGSGNFDETAVTTILGEDDYVLYTQKRDLAQKTFTATSGIATMDPADMEARFSEYTPDPAAPDFAAQQSVQAAVQKEVDRVTRLRASQPDKAALEFPEVKGSYQALQDQLTSGSAQPAQVQSFVQQMMSTQRGFGTQPKAVAPVPSEWAMEIGQSLSRLPEPARANANEIRAQILAQYQSLHQYFGDYTDEVVTYALSEYKGLNPTTAKMINGYMAAIATGKAADQVIRIDSALDADQVEGFSGPRKNIFGETPFPDYWFPSGDEGLSTEEQLRLDAAGVEPTEE